LKFDSSLESEKGGIEKAKFHSAKFLCVKLLTEVG